MISILVPTRHRPKNIQRLWRSVVKTVSDINNIELIVYIDNDDPSYDEVMNVPMTRVRGDRIVLSEMWNRCYEHATGDILMHCGDDIIFRTKGWDAKVEDTFAQIPDRIAFVFGDDGSPHNGTFGTHGFIHREWVKAVGYFVPPYFSSDYNDTWLNDVAKMIDRHIHIDIFTEHMHPDLKKARLDITHKERIERHQRDNVAQLYESKLEERKQDAEKLRGVMV